MMRRVVIIGVWLVMVLGGAMLQADSWTLIEDCATQSDSPTPFTGVILSYDPEAGVRALRDEVGTSYFIAFAGSNFNSGGAVSPDGRWFAVPYGYIQTAATSDIRHRVNELRVYSTERVPQLRVRMSWDASFQARGFTAEASIPQIPPIRWLDAETLLFQRGNLTEGYDLVTVNPFTQTITESDLDRYSVLSPDASRGIVRDVDHVGVFDTEGGERLARFPVLSPGLTLFAWSPDASRFATIQVFDSVRQLALFDRDGDFLESVATFTQDQLLWNFSWSADGERFAYSLYDPYENENFLYVGDGDTRTITATCLQLRNQHDGRFTYSAVWDADGERLAVLPLGGELAIYEVSSGMVYPVGGYTGGLLAWGAE